MIRMSDILWEVLHEADTTKRVIQTPSGFRGTNADGKRAYFYGEEAQQKAKAWAYGTYASKDALEKDFAASDRATDDENTVSTQAQVPPVTAEDAVSFFFETQHDMMDLDEDTRKVVTNYCGSGYMALNAVLRNPNQSLRYLSSEDQGEVFQLTKDETNNDEELKRLVAKYNEMKGDGKGRSGILSQIKDRQIAVEAEVMERVAMKRYAPTCDVMDKLIREATPTKEPMQVYRGIKRDIGNKMLEMFEDHTGDEIQDMGYVSTSLSTMTADGFAGYKGGVVLRITLPPGTRALYPDAGAMTAHPHELEVILARGARFRVEGVERAQYDGNNEVHLTYLPDK